jgi:predicted rRNA methylase YqxC with S4 and FtsJ domains
VVRDAAVHEEVIARVKEGIEAAGFRFEGIMASPVPGAVSGNKEFLAHFTRKHPIEADLVHNSDLSGKNDVPL